VVAEVIAFLRERIDACWRPVSRANASRSIPDLALARRVEHNYALLRAYAA
jgi:hypothetical protein